MIKAKQIHKNHKKPSPEQIVEFLEDFATLMSGKDKPTQAISIRVPGNVLEAFKFKAQQEEKKYQSVIVKLMREWVSSK